MPKENRKILSRRVASAPPVSGLPSQPGGLLDADGKSLHKGMVSADWMYLTKVLCICLEGLLPADQSRAFGYHMRYLGLLGRSEISKKGECVKQHMS
jgi:hypothetical protein